jgi:hypothetical protein
VPTAGASLISNTSGGSIVIEPVDGDVGAGGSKSQRHRATDPLLRPCNQNYLASQLHVSAPMILPFHGSKFGPAWRVCRGTWVRLGQRKSTLNRLELSRPEPTRYHRPLEPSYEV